jgi:lipoyl(octanoyl) transferase
VSQRRRLLVRRLGRIGYAEGVELQKSLVQQRIAGEIDDTLLFVEHPPVITLGVKTRGNLANARADAGVLAAQGVEVHESGRGGDVTFHGPGQLVGYPIVDLKPDRQDVHRYVRDLEEVLIRTAADFGIQAGRVKGFSGAWVGDVKLAAIGVRISRWVTSHGFALNVSTDLAGFGLIVPCGITDRGVTSLSALLGRDVPMADVERSVVTHFSAVFDRETIETSSDTSRR